MLDNDLYIDHGPWHFNVFELRHRRRLTMLRRLLHRCCFGTHWSLPATASVRQRSRMIGSITGARSAIPGKSRPCSISSSCVIRICRSFLRSRKSLPAISCKTALTSSFTAGNVTAGLVGPFTALGSATAAGTYTDRPTVVYSPLTGVDFLRRLMTPIPPSSVMFMLQAGYAAQRVMPIMLDSINGIANGSNR